MDKIKIDTGGCKACGLCVHACPKGLLKLGDNINLGGYRYVVITDEQACVSCANCAVSCPDRALSVYKADGA